ncbi:HTH-type transcriptional regulator YofA [Roseovarius litorisediminis]|uniref:HTH-type transcriptional regulator YofA n=1 Tax=Roseovarius litorisediminis TaxID=1312363 RepID=A0A1Y5S2E9_9RHOB|nr:LysR family transcriptional regulator [Roseovarius litorisediminis]SLN28430.1 HTH-type transcriptional regulator YofA [Roseovarius litorisediminis]
MATRISTDTNLIKAMEVFVAIVETGQMTAAARLVGLTQSAASQHIANLERTYDVRLIDRSTRPVKPTQAGTLMYRHAARILNSVADLATDLRHQGPHPISVLRVGMLASIATTLSVPLVQLAKDRFNVQDMTLHAGQSGDHETLLRTKRADVVISSNPFYDMDGLERHDVLQEAFLLVLPASYNGPQQNLGDILQNLPLVRFADTTSVGRQIEQHLRRLKLQVPRVIQADRSSMVTACVARGMGFTLLSPTLLIDGFVEKMPMNIRPLPVAGLSRRITVVARDKEMGGLPLAFADIARDALLRQIGQQMGNVGLDAITVDDDRGS